MINPMLCGTIFVILVVWFLLPRVATLMIHTPTAVSVFFSSRRRHTMLQGDWSSDVCSSDLAATCFRAPRGACEWVRPREGRARDPDRPPAGGGLDGHAARSDRRLHGQRRRVPERPRERKRGGEGKGVDLGGGAVIRKKERTN